GQEGGSRVPQGDIVYLRATVQAGGGGLLLRVESSASLQLFLDGRRVLERDLFRRLLPRSQWLEISAPNGPHRLLVKAAVGEVGRTLRIQALPRSAGELPPTQAALIRELEATFGAGLGRTLGAVAIGDLDPHGALGALSGPAASQPSAPELGDLGLSLRA